ncbi:MAG: hypothetical protein JO225_09705 [Candidatus Eremiobacteraeota bacterium]|nr:hypothetical protein [Candidatus Eremiobacteraeota bacterium]MBV8644173.1 hypothetical protein [Candidatus Eremiobacteraeota bacterium]
MAYNLTVVNNYTVFFFDNGNRIFDKGTHQFDDLSGNHTLQLFGMGDLIIHDIADKKLDQYTNPKIPWTNYTWGGVIRYRGHDAYFRYEGANGNIKMTIDFLGSVDVHFEQGGMAIFLDDMTVS